MKKKPKPRNPIAHSFGAGINRPRIVPNKKALAKRFACRRSAV